MNKKFKLDENPWPILILDRYIKYHVIKNLINIYRQNGLAEIDGNFPL